MSRRLKISAFTLEGLNSFATVLYFNYLYFFMRDTFGFDNKHNLLLASFLGLVYVFAAWQAGKFAQHYGYFNALKLGFSIMAVSLAAGAFLHTAVGAIIAASCVTIGMCFIWPTLEAMVSDSESAARLPNIVGMYNVVWAVTNAAAFFIGGTLIEMTEGHKIPFLPPLASEMYKIIFLLPFVVVIAQMILVFWMQRHATDLAREALNQPKTELPPEPHRPASPRAKAFLKMAWMANPFAYIAIQTLIAITPGIRDKFHLSTMMAGFVCTLWCFVRLGFFVVFWHWTDWHYRFRWLVISFILLILSFATILMAPNLAVLIVAQIFFGGAIGLIYYSSLFYSMDAGDTRGEHGGIHEAAIGLGNCLGPAIGAAAMQWAPGNPNSGAIAVSALLLCGLGGLIGIWKQADKKHRTSNTER